MPGVSRSRSSAASLLDEVGRLDPGDRIRRAVATGLAAAPDDRRGLLAELGAGDGYARRLAVAVAAATRDGEHLTDALADPRPGVRAGAFTDALPDAAVAEVVLNGSLADRRRAAAWLSRMQRAELADRLLDPVLQRWGDGEAARVLAACSPPVVAQRLPELAHAITRWTTLTARLPELVSAHADADLAACDVEGRPLWWERNPQIVGALIERRPAVVLDLVERWVSGRLPAQVIGQLHRLLAVDASRVVRLVLADPDRVRQLARTRLRKATRHRLAGLPDAEVGALLRASGPSTALLEQLLRGRAPQPRYRALPATTPDRDSFLAKQSRPANPCVSHHALVSSAVPNRAFTTVIQNCPS